MDPTRKRAACYLRISEDRTGLGDGVGRQREDCLALADRRQLDLAPSRILEENDTSASGKKARPIFNQLITLIENHEIDVVIAWALDRLVRAPRDRLRLVEACRDHSVMIMLVRGSDLDPTTPSGRLHLGILGEVAEHEIAAKADRQRRAAQQSAEQGRPPVGGAPFGYERVRAEDGHGRRSTVQQIHPERGALVAAAYTEILRGGSVNSIVRRWNAAGETSGRQRCGRKTGASEWSRHTVKTLLLNPAYKGVRVYKGAEVGPATWPPLIDEMTFEAVREILTRPERRTVANYATKYLLSGLARCAVCREPLTSGSRGRGYYTYRCSSGQHLSRRGDWLDALIAGGELPALDEPFPGLVVDRVLQPDVRDRLLQRRAAAAEGARPLAALRDERTATEVRLAGLAKDYADGILDRTQVKVAGDELRAKLKEITAQIAEVGRVSTAGRLAASDDVAGDWAGFAVTERRSAIDELMEIEVHPAGSGTRSFNPSTVVINWKTV